MHRVSRWLGPAVAAVGFVLFYVMSTVVMDQVRDSVLVALATVTAAAIALAVYGRVSLFEAVRENGSAAALAAAGGVAILWLAPLIVLSQRASDAPSGAVVLFHTTALWGVIAAFSWWVRTGPKATYLAAAGAVASAVGAAGVLANWERPSSFSPFIKYLQPELLIVAAGLVFVAGAYALVAAARKLDTGAVLVVSTGAATVLSLVLAGPALGSSLPSVSRLSTEFILLGVGAYAIAWGWSRSVVSLGVARSASTLLVAPALTTVLSVLERVTGVHGPDPIQWGGAMPAAVLCVTAAAVTLLASAEGRGAQYRPHALRAAVALSAAAAVAAAVGLALPALRARSVGTLPVYFEAEWVMRGFQSAAGWLPFAGAAVVLAAAVLASRGSGVYATMAASLVGFVTAWAYRPLLQTPLHTWQNWIPSDVQQTYGTEYALFSVETITSPVSIVAVVLTALAAALLLLSIVRFAPVEDDS